MKNFQVVVLIVDHFLIFKVIKEHPEKNHLAHLYLDTECLVYRCTKFKEMNQAWMMQQPLLTSTAQHVRISFPQLTTAKPVSEQEEDN